MLESVHDAVQALPTSTAASKHTLQVIYPITAVLGTYLVCEATCVSSQFKVYSSEQLALETCTLLSMV